VESTPSEGLLTCKAGPGETSEKGSGSPGLLGYFSAATARRDIPAPGPVLCVDLGDAPVGTMSMQFKAREGKR
jgi:hypothetical protein